MPIVGRVDSNDFCMFRCIESDPISLYARLYTKIDAVKELVVDSFMFETLCI